MNGDSAAGCVDWTGSAMTDDRPRPQYGEYATPEQQAAAMGKQYVPQDPPPRPETRVNLAAPTASGTPTPAEQMRLPGNAADRFATIFQLGVGVVVLINSDYFNASSIVNSAFSQAGETLRVSASLDHYAWLLLAANGVFLVLTALWAYRRIRHDKLAFFVPAIGYLAFIVFLGAVAGLASR